MKGKIKSALPLVILLFIVISLILFIVISLATQASVTDTREYTHTAKFFAGEYSAKLRTSHPLTYGLIHAPFIKLFHSFLIMRVTSILCLILIVLSVYHISNKDKKTLLLLLVSPIIWYMGPAINPIQLAGLLFLWGFFFFLKFDKNSKITNLIYSGILIGLALCFWHTALIILFFFVICFFYNRNINLLIVFIFSVLIGLFPLILIDQIYYGFPFITLIKFIAMHLVFLTQGSIYQGMKLLSFSFVAYISFIIMLPFFGYTLFSKSFFKENKKLMIFLTLSFLFFLINPQTRYIIFLWPILMLYLPKLLNKEQFKIQFIIFCIITLLIITSYIIQIKYPNNTGELVSMIGGFKELNSSLATEEKLIQEDLNNLTKEYPNQVFVVGNEQDSYGALAYYYWGDKVKEFVSIEDYILYLNKNPILFEKEFKTKPDPNYRRQVWLKIGMSKNEADNTNYENITLSIGIKEPLKIQGFNVIKKYKVLYLSELPENETPVFLGKNAYNLD